MFLQWLPLSAACGWCSNNAVLSIVMIDACRVTEDGSFEAVQQRENQLLVWSTSATRAALGTQNGGIFTQQLVKAVRDSKSEGHDIESIVMMCSAATQRSELPVDAQEQLQGGKQVPVRLSNWIYEDKVVLRCHDSFIRFLRNHPKIESIDDLVDHFIKYPPKLKALRLTCSWISDEPEEASDDISAFTDNAARIPAGAFHQQHNIVQSPEERQRDPSLQELEQFAALPRPIGAPSPGLQLHSSRHYAHIDHAANPGPAVPPSAPAPGSCDAAHALR